MAVLNVDLTDYDTVDFDLALIPPGDYEVLIVDSRLTQSLTLSRLPPASGACSQRQSVGVGHTGNFSHSSLKAAEFEFVVQGPVCRGAKLRDSFTLGEDASMRRMKALAVAAQCRNPDFIGDTEELHGLRCRVRVERVGGPGSSGKNVISAYLRSCARFPLAGMHSGGSPFASLSSDRQVTAQRVETRRSQKACARPFPWEG